MQMSLILSVALFAATAVKPETLDVITVTSRRPQALADTLAEVTVIERADIEASQAPDVLELLRFVPGIDLVRTGGSGQTSSVFMRGSNSNHVLFLIDGVRIASTNTGAAAFEHLPIDQIERIEIVRGPRASYYGSDAMGGVIAVTTRERNGAGGLLRIGSNGRFGAAAGYGASGERGAFSVQVGGENYDGFSAQTAAGFSYDPDDDGYENRNLGLRGRVAFGEQQLSVSGLAMRADVDFDQGQTAVDQDALAVVLDGPLRADWTHRLTLATAREDVDTPAFSARFVTRRQQLDWLHDVNLGAGQQLIFGINAQRERGASIDTFSNSPAYTQTLNHQAGFVGWQGRHGAFDHELSLRYDDHESFGGKATGQAALGWRFAGGRVFASWGQGFRAPNLNELYSPGFGGLFAGNANLDPERSRSLELGIDARLGEVDLGVNIYRTRFDDLIAFQGNQTFQAINIARAAVDGVELTLARSWGALTLDGNATWQDARDSDTQLQLLRRPDHKAAIDVSYAFDNGIRVSADAGYVSKRRDFAADLAAYTVVGLRAEGKINQQWSLGARLGNALDRDYAWAAGFASTGRELIVTLRWQQLP